MATRFIKAKDITPGDLIVWSFDGTNNKHSTLVLFHVNRVEKTFRVAPSHSPEDDNEVLIGNGVSLFGDRLLHDGGAIFNREYWFHENRTVVFVEGD